MEEKEGGSRGEVEGKLRKNRIFVLCKVEEKLRKIREKEERRKFPPLLLQWRKVEEMEEKGGKG